MAYVIFGITNADPLQFSNHATNDLKDMRWKMITKNLSATPVGIRYFGFLGVRSFIASFRHLPEQAVVVIFDIAERLIELNPIVILDMKPKSIEKLGESVFNFIFPVSTIQPVFHQNDYIRSIISTMKSDEFLHAYNTFFYKIQKDSRQVVRDAVLRYLNSKITQTQFETTMRDKFAKRPRGADPVEQIYHLVNSERGQDLKKAVLEVQKGADAETVASKSTVSSFEILYCMSYLNQK